MPKTTSTSDARQALRHNPLAEDYSPSYPLKQKSTKKRARRSEEAQDQFVDSKASQKILRIGRELAEEEEAEKRENHTETNVNAAFTFGSRSVGDEVDEAGALYDDDDDTWGDEEEDLEYVEEVEIDPNDLELFNKFNPTSSPSFENTMLQTEDKEEKGEPTNLTDLILQKIAAFEAGEERLPGVEVDEEPPDDAVELPVKVVEAYSK